MRQDKIGLDLVRLDRQIGKKTKKTDRATKATHSQKPKARLENKKQKNRPP